MVVDCRRTWRCPLCHQNFGKVEGYGQSAMESNAITHLFTACKKTKLST